MSANAPLRYRGFSSRYMDIAVRGTVHLGLAIDYAVHPSNVGCFIVRFVAHGEGIKPKDFTHLFYREPAKFLAAATETAMQEVIKGVRLTKIAIPVFTPGIHAYEVDYFATKHGVWDRLTEWVQEQVGLEGFTLTPMDLLGAIKTLVGLPVATPEESVKVATDYPDLTLPEYKAAAAKYAAKAPVEDEDDTPAHEGDDDEDDDEDGDDDKGWLN